MSDAKFRPTPEKVEGDIRSVFQNNLNTALATKEIGGDKIAKDLIVLISNYMENNLVATMQDGGNEKIPETFTSMFTAMSNMIALLLYQVPHTEAKNNYYHGIIDVMNKTNSDLNNNPFGNGGVEISPGVTFHGVSVGSDMQNMPDEIRQALCGILTPETLQNMGIDPARPPKNKLN